MEKIDYFKTELEYISDDKLRDDTKYLVSNLPDYFFEIPAASTGKYHPKFASGEHGLVRHTKVAVYFANELMNNSAVSNFTNREKDLIIISLILHDGLKSGKTKEKYTRFDHPLLAADYVKDNQDKLSMTSNDIDFISDAISSHMGNWNVDYKGNEVLPKPKNKYQRFVHMCDYLASRKMINVEFDGVEIKE